MAPIKHFTIDQGSNFFLEVALTDLNDNPVNLTGYTFRSQMRKSYGSNSYTAFTVTADADRTTGKLYLTLTATQTSGLRAGRYVYDIEIVSAINEVTRVLEGITTVTPEVTR
jgi:hypothetical protein